MCPNKEDLKWCKAASLWNVPDNWTSMSDGSWDGTPNVQEKCTIFLNDTDPRGQWINAEDFFDGKRLQCINRTDENPFSYQKNLTDDYRWLQLVHSSCFHSNSRRCLGDKPNQCVCE